MLWTLKPWSEFLGIIFSNITAIWLIWAVWAIFFFSVKHIAQFFCVCIPLTPSTILQIIILECSVQNRKDKAKSKMIRSAINTTLTREGVLPPNTKLQVECSLERGKKKGGGKDKNRSNIYNIACSHTVGLSKYGASWFMVSPHSNDMTKHAI